MDLRDSIHNEILSGDYECVICLNSIDSNAKIWSCDTCYRALHLSCTKAWGERNVEKKKSWVCPYCQTEQKESLASLKNKCWCGKGEPRRIKQNSDPKHPSSKKNLIPHSCGKKCNAPRSCRHPCPLVCHAGPHEEVSMCRQRGPRISCFCGKHKSESKPCNETQYNGFSCEEVCGKPNQQCGHRCTKICHKPKRSSRRRGSKSTSVCGPCDVKISVSCYCGKITNQLRKCSSLTNKERSKLRRSNGSSEPLMVSCQHKCENLLNCGKHKCESICHDEETVSHECKFAVKENETCYCGSTLAQRSSCEDPIPMCGNVCFKKLQCGHFCRKTCHPGECPPCIEPIVDVTCRCTSSKVEAPCYQVTSNSATCTKKCGALLSCHRHHCDIQCCEFTPKAVPKSVRKNNNLTVSVDELLSVVDLNDTPRVSTNTASRAERERHLCRRICGRPLACGKHTCLELCHTGKCPPCAEVSFDEWVCGCGKTVVQPPIRCGTLMPTCRHRCTRVRPCGHSGDHLCHEDDVECPPCMHTLSFPCKCGESQVNVYCFESASALQKIENYNCYTPCGKELPCGHKCQKRCCDRTKDCPPCSAPCEQKNPVCGHTHVAKCHYPDPCPDSCGIKLLAKCPCSVLQCAYECGEDVEIGCNELCVREHYTPFILREFEEDPAWMINTETELRSFIRKGDRKALRFKPMSTKKRMRVYALLEHYGLKGESQDMGTNRSVCVYLTPERHITRYTLRTAPRKDPVLGIDIPALCKPLRSVYFQPKSFIQEDDTEEKESDNVSPHPTEENEPLKEVSDNDKISAETQEPENSVTDISPEENVSPEESTSTEESISTEESSLETTDTVTNFDHVEKETPSNEESSSEIIVDEN